MAKPETLTPEEMDLRRRARRRLVGAIALALLAVVVLPMLFNPEPKPLGPEVEIRIPAPSTPFAPRGELQEAPAAQAEDEPARQALPPAPVVSSSPAPAPTVNPVPPVAARPTPGQAPAPPATRPAQLSEARAPASAAADASAPDALSARGFYLQLGAFTQEANARQLAERARAAGFDVVVQEAGGQVRVRMGPFKERGDALQAQAKLRALGIGSILLGS